MSNNDPAAAPWLGLLKWSLQYTDGTRPSEESPTAMSDEDRAFLESVMRDGIVNEGERMRVVLSELAAYAASASSSSGNDEDDARAVGLLEELSDVVEQVDHARALSVMGGTAFLLGVVAGDVGGGRVPASVRRSCASTLATAAQNNPPVQERALRDENALGALGGAFLRATAAAAEEDPDGVARAALLKALSCVVRGHAVGEESLCRDERSRSVLGLGLGAVALTPTDGATPPPPPPPRLRLRALFLLRALLTSDTSSRRRVRDFENCVRKVVEGLLLDDHDDEGDAVADAVRELSLGLVSQILSQKRSVDAVLDDKDALVAKGVFRVSALRRRRTDRRGDPPAEEDAETRLWEDVLVRLSRSERDADDEEEKTNDTNDAEPTLAIAGPPATNTGTDPAQ